MKNLLVFFCTIAFSTVGRAQVYNRIFNYTDKATIALKLLNENEPREDFIKRIQADCIPCESREIAVGAGKCKVGESARVNCLQDAHSPVQFLIVRHAPDSLDTYHRQIKNLIKWHTGIYHRDFIHAVEIKKPEKTSVVVTLNHGDYLMIASIPMTFPISAGMTETSSQQQDQVVEAFRETYEFVLQWAEWTLPENRQFLIPDPNADRLTPSQRVEGLSVLWQAAKNHFAYFHQVPDLDWDLEYARYLPMVIEDQSDYDYYRLLQRFCALLKDGHTNVYMPSSIRQNDAIIPIRLKHIENKTVVVNTSITIDQEIPVGSIVTHIENTPINEYLATNIFPYISSSTDYIRQSRALREISEGLIDSELKVTYTIPHGITKTEKLIRKDPFTVQWQIESPRRELFVSESIADHIVYQQHNSYGNSRIIDSFFQSLPSLQKAKGLLIDLRKNGGGNSSNGYEILKYLSKDALVTSKWRTRETRSAYVAWGQSFKGRKNEERTDYDALYAWAKNAYDYAHGDKWYEGNPDTISPYSDQFLNIPIVVLYGNNTASAAEDFLIAASDNELITTVGDLSYGSTGQPLMFDLPGGGSARVCTKQDTYPDGREFVGFGIKPDIYILEKITHLLTPEDEVLDQAIDILKSKMK